MNIRQGLFGVVGAFIGCTVATAGDMGLMTSTQGIHPVFHYKADMHQLMPAAIHSALMAQILMCLPTIITEAGKTLVL